MKVKILIGAVFAGCILGSLAFAQSLQIKGKVADLKPNMITLTSDTETWCVRQGPGTNTAVVSGDLIVGKPVTLKCNCPDAQRKEGPVCFPTPSPMATPKPTPTATAANG